MGALRPQAANVKVTDDMNLELGYVYAHTDNQTDKCLLGGGEASGLLWLTQMMPRDGHAGTLSIPRDWAWIITGVAATAAYALVFGPSVRF